MECPSSGLKIHASHPQRVTACSNTHAISTNGRAARNLRKALAKAGHPVLPAYRDRRAFVSTGSSACADDDASTWGVTNLRRHAPRKRGIQYSRHVETDGRS